MSSGPVFLLAGGGRTGSTLIQRLILSSRRVLMWGEHGGVLIPQLRHLVGSTHAYITKADGNQMRENFVAQGHGTWVANMNPEMSYYQSGCRAFLDQSLGAAARAMGYERWGFKEIRYGRTGALVLQELFPDASFILLVRDPVHCLKSIKGTNWYAKDFQASPVKFLNAWTRINAELAEVRPHLKHCCFIRYEDAISNPQKITEEISRTIQIPFSAFDLSTFDKILRGSPSPPSGLSKEDFDAMGDGNFLAVASMLNYEVPTENIADAS